MRRLAAAAALIAAVVVALTLILSGGSVPQSAGGSIHPPGWGRPAPRTYSLGQSGPTAVMFDAINPAAFPSRPFALAGYTSGRWPTFAGLVRSFPHAHLVSIAISWGGRARCLDVEPGDATPGQVVAWVRVELRVEKPCVYSSYWEFVNQVRPALAAGGITRSSVWEWDASYTGRPGITPSFDATQFTDKALGRNLDESTVTLAFLGINPKPQPKPVRCIHHRLLKVECSARKAKIARDRRALAASWQAFDVAHSTLVVNGCRRPWRRRICRVAGRGSVLFTRRIRFFAGRVVALEAAS